MSPHINDIVELEKVAVQIRRDIVRMVHQVQSGHPGGSLGCTDLLVALYFRIMRYEKSFNMDGRNEDLFFLSNGHISPVFYATLARAGFFDPSELHTFRKINARLQGHPTTHDHLPGVRMSSGSLGQGVSVAIGAAMSKKLNQDDKLVYCLTGDGELQEGQIWEGLMFASHHQVDNLIMLIDHNGQQIDGPTKTVMNLANCKDKLLAFGWFVIEMNGNNMNEVVDSLEYAVTCTKKSQPVAIVMTTIMGKGVDFMEGTHEWHGIAPNDEQLVKALKQLPSIMKDY
ncbi:MAG: transketolase [Phycisphaerales bacterium]|nr:transketolase [Phycisphaerales bacterium]